jgi:hypothetical protein
MLVNIDRWWRLRGLEMLGRALGRRLRIESVRPLNTIFVVRKTVPRYALQSRGTRELVRRILCAKPKSSKRGW